MSVSGNRVRIHPRCHDPGGPGYTANLMERHASFENSREAALARATR